MRVLRSLRFGFFLILLLLAAGGVAYLVNTSQQAQNGQAPAGFARTSSNGVPRRALLLSIFALLLGVLLGLPILALILWLMGAAGPRWWLWAWGAWMAFNLLILVLYPTLIAPLFNGFKARQKKMVPGP